MTASPELEEQTIEDAGRDSARVICWMVWLKPHRQAACKPGVLRNLVTTEHFAAITIKSCTRLILLTAAAISGVTPGANAASAGVVASSERASRGIRRTVRCATGAKAVWSCFSTMSALPHTSRREQRAHEGTWPAANRREHVGRRHALRPCLRKGRPVDRRCAMVMPSPANSQDREMCKGERPDRRTVHCEHQLLA